MCCDNLTLVAVSATKTMTSPNEVEKGEASESEPLVETSAEKQEPLRAAPVRAFHAGIHFVFLLFGKEYGWAGFCYLVIGTTCSVATSVHVNWLAGCAMMMLFFATCFCFAGYQAVSGKYELARPLMLAAMMMFLSCILGGHFFVVWSKSAGKDVIKGASLADLPKVAKNYEENTVFYLKDGSVGTDYIGEFKYCKDKLPVVGTCVYDYYCTAPLLDTTYEKGVVAYAWVATMSHVSCSDPTFEKNVVQASSSKNFRAGLGVRRTHHYTKSIEEASTKFSIKTASNAPIIKWMADPTLDEKSAWHTGWLVEFVVFTLYLFVMLIYSYCMGFTEDALPQARKIMDPYAPQKPSRRKKVES